MQVLEDAEPSQGSEFPEGIRLDGADPGEAIRRVLKAVRAVKADAETVPDLRGGDRFAGKRILHFAPEKFLLRQMAGNPLYETADLMQQGVTHQVDITKVPLPHASYDIVMAHHVLEHIPDDRQAMREMFRLLKPGGIALLSVPINATRHATHEKPGIEGDAARWAHFDVYCWNPSTKPGRPEGGEAQAARLMYDLIEKRATERAAK